MNGIEEITSQTSAWWPMIERCCRIIIWLSIASAFYREAGTVATAKGATVAPSSVDWVLSAQNHLLVNVTLNGHPASFLIDTGSPFSAVDVRKAGSLGLTAITGSMRLPKQLLVNSREAPVARIKQLIVGSDDLGSGPVVLIDLHGFPEFRHAIFSRSEVVGILGLDVLQKYSAVIDFGKRQLILETQNGLPETLTSALSMYHKVPIRVSGTGALEVAGKIGANTYSFIVDTGSSGTVVPVDVAVDNRLSVRWSKFFSKMINFAPSLVGRTTIPVRTLGNYSFKRSSAYVTSMPLFFGDLEYPFGGLIGNDFFASTSAIIDVGHRFLYAK
jgi:predicted aspartyl protease